MKYVSLIFSLCLFAGPLWAAESSVSTEAFAQKLWKLRGEIENLGLQSESQIQQNKAEKDVLLQRRTELQGQQRKELLREEQLKNKIAENRKRLAPLVKTPAADLQFLQDWVRELEIWVESSLPYKTEERKAGLKRISEQLSAAEMSPEQATAELWAWIEKELQLSKENENLVMEIPGPESKETVEALRLGLFRLAVKTPSGEWRVALEQDQKWNWARVKDAEAQASLDRMMAYFKERKRSGYFEWPSREQLELSAKALPKSQGDSQ